MKESTSPHSVTVLQGKNANYTIYVRHNGTWASQETDRDRKEDGSVTTTMHGELTGFSEVYVWLLRREPYSVRVATLCPGEGGRLEWDEFGLEGNFELVEYTNNKHAEKLWKQIKREYEK